MRKKIGLLLPTRPQDGGQHQYALLIMNALVKKKDADYDLVAFCGNDYWRKWCKKKGVRYIKHSMPDISMKERLFNYRFPLPAKLYYTYMTSFGKTIRAEKIDILFSTQQGMYLPDYAVKLMSPVHDLMHRYEPDFPEVKDSFESRELHMKSLAKYTTCILVDSKVGKRQFEESYIKTKKRRPHIISLPFIAPEHIQKTEEAYLEVPDKYVFYPAQFWKHKNHMNLLKAIQILAESLSDIHLVLVGSERNNGREIKKYIRDNGLESHVTILGFVSDENITYLYRHAVGLIMPSYFGPTNIPPLEAMALGCPVAVSNKYAMPEQVGRAGLLFHPDSPEEIADCIKRLWTDDNLRERMRKDGYQRSKMWTKEKFEKKLCKIIDTI